jgi:ATP-dependent protease ClpP protease subunit
MSLKKLPQINAKAAPDGLQWDTSSDAVAKWDTTIVAKENDNSTITIYDSIGSEGWSEGVTAKRISAALRSIGAKDVEVLINSPGGDFFEGIAIYNLLREHPHKVTVKVIGLAASAASIIAMAGDERMVAKSGFLMIHNAWAVVIGNRHDLDGAASVLEEFDGAMAQLYADVSGMTKKAAAKMMDNETWMNGQSSIDAGFATSLLPDDEVKKDTSKEGKEKAAIRKVDMMLAKQGLPRSERKLLMQEIKGTPGAAHSVTPGADADIIKALMDSAETLKHLTKEQIS